MSLVHAVIMLLCALLFLPGGISGEESDMYTTSITLERGMCYGTCPVYSLALFSNGSVIYDGQMFVKERGIRNSTINETSFTRLMELADEMGFYEMDEMYTAYDITDMPSATITITNGTRKRVEHYYGDMNAPEVLTALEDAIDQAAHVTQWTLPFDPGYSEGRQI